MGIGQDEQEVKKAGLDEIIIEIASTLDDFGIEMIMKIINEIYYSGEMSEDLNRSIFVELPKNRRENVSDLCSENQLN